MTIQKLILEIPNALFQKLESLAQATDQSTESLVINCINRSLPQVAEELQQPDKEINFQENFDISESDFSDYLSNLEDYEERLARGEIQW